MVPISYNVRSLLVRKTTSFATAFGIALVVFVLAASMMLQAGIQKTMGASGERDHAIVLRKGSDAELTSSIDLAAVKLVMTAPGVKAGPSGPSAVGELAAVIAAEKVGEPGKISNLQIRGVPDNALEFRKSVHVVSGRPAQPGTDEVIIGARIAGRFVGCHLGGKFDLKKNRPVTVVGVFEAEGSAFESEVWADAETVRAAFGRDNLVSSVTVQLESPSKFDAFSLQVESDKRLGLNAMREKEYYEKAAEGTATFMGVLGMVIAIFFSFGAMLGALITMHGAVAQRQREIGTLRALGFSRFSILLSFLLEAVMLSIAGGLFGGLAALGLAFVEVPMMNMTTWSEVVFKFQPTTAVLITAIVAGGIMGTLGGFLPAIRAARTSPVKAMRG